MQSSLCQVPVHRTICHTPPASASPKRNQPPLLPGSATRLPPKLSPLPSMLGYTPTTKTQPTSFDVLASASHQTIDPKCASRASIPDQARTFLMDLETK